MKKLFLTAMAFVAMMSAMSFTSCSDDDTNDNGGGGGGGSTTGGVELNGAIEGTVTLEADKEYRLTGAVTVPDGATLNIPAGTTIRATQGFSSYILVERGGTINAEGTADKPIVFTADTDNATAGYWGGLIINGNAPITGGGEGVTEIDNNVSYGGNDANDNSGVIRYVELWYTGARSSADIEHNGLTLNGVGNGTTIENVYIAEGADDGIEFFGGTVNVSNLLVVNCDDDCFDFTQGYSGTLTNCYGIWEDGFTSTEEDPRGVEADGNLDGDMPDGAPQADFTINGMTIVNNSSTQSMQDAIKVRRGATAHITDAVVYGSGQIENLIDLTDGKGGAGSSTDMSVSNNAYYISDATINDGGTTYSGVNVETGNDGADVSALNWTGYEFPQLNNTTVAAAGDLPLEISSPIALEAGQEYFINGSVHVKEGGVLLIPAGMTIKAKEGFSNFILVERGGKIYATGREDAPITFTADASNATAGYWGGIIINGNAVISGPSGSVNEGVTEIDNNVPYGGDQNNDNSGVLTYVSILYSGARSSADIEHNGLTLNGVGAGTTIENIYIAEGADDGIEFFGGSVNVSNLLVVNCDDDCFDFTQGYSGTLTNCYGRWEAGFTSTESDPRGVEADGNLDGEGSTAHSPQSDFTIDNMTIENLSSYPMQDAIKVRRLAKATINNALVIGSGEIQELVDLTDGLDDADPTSIINVTNGATNVGAQTNSGNPEGATVNIADGNTGCETDIFGWTGYTL